MLPRLDSYLLLLLLKVLDYRYTPLCLVENIIIIIFLLNEEKKQSLMRKEIVEILKLLAIHNLA